MNGGLFDPGVQLERTHLAWSRTALAFIADAAFTARASARMHPPALGVAVAIALALTGVGAWLYGRTSYARRATDLRLRVAPVRPRAIRLLATAAAVLSVAAAALALTTLGS
jgi:uncharacterized membrane protein YidH (DUF202 family)